jgi:hypothetical protein
MLTPLTFAYQAIDVFGRKSTTPRAGSVKSIVLANKRTAAKSTQDGDSPRDIVRPYESPVFTATRIAVYLGACAVFARANPNLSGPAKVFMYVLFLAIADLYLIYFGLRMFLAQIGGKRDYETLATPAPFFSRKTSSSRSG